MHTSTDSAVKPSQRYTYVSLLVIDGERKLKPASVSLDLLEFRTPPQLLSSEVEIVVTNGDWQDPPFGGGVTARTRKQPRFRSSI